MNNLRRLIGRSSTSQSKSPASPTPAEYMQEPDENAEGDNSTPQLTNEYFKRYELMTEFINLRNPSHCPLGVYVIPSSDNLNVWYGVVFVHKGYYRSGVFKFRMTIPENYPNHPPSVTFLTEMFHPLVDTQGNLSLSQQFATWRPYQDYLFHVLHYVKNIFKRVVLDGLVDKHCPHKEAYRLYRTDRTVFGKLAQQSAQLSITESYLFDHFPENNLIKFSKLSEAEYEDLRTQILDSARSS
ncbi:ubc-like protein [Lichtheimia corymbifera JMRC:FSU:9682]|uniref:Ubc-like protein n=1 Tax=Lichtheimia corymbifera JMRC:FSU:9682 TaxID=1263082 RepID=A0A068RHF7_9FUNG|nr:ubc-like protein [Lichtheimia corymbifera JMRC:FSU:9682]